LSKLNLHLRKSFIILISVLFFSACDLLQFKNNGEGEDGVNSEPLASVGEVYLYKKDIAGIVPKNISQEDSIDLIERHIQSWIKKQLVIAEAQKQLTFDEVELDRRVLDYRYALMMHEFEKHNIQRRLDTNITEEEIETYYSENIDNFELKQNIIRGYFIQLSKDAPNLGRFRYLLRSNREDHVGELKSFAYSYSTKVHLDDSAWVNFEDVINNTPLMELQNKTDFLRRNTYYETSDETNLYFLKILQYKIQNDKSPLEFVRDDIQKIILNKRKVALAKELEGEIYENAVKNDGFEVY